MCSSSVLLSIFDCSQENSKDAVFEMLRAMDIVVSELASFFHACQNLIQKLNFFQQAMAEDKLPTNMCIACIAELNKAYSFQSNWD
jgi:hypothetical protein